MNLIRILQLQIVLLLPILTYGQERQLAMGDQLTKKEMENIISGGEGNQSINSRAKLFIIDFWDVSCISCIAAFPKMDSLQKAFDDQIQVILINRQSRDSTERFFSKRKKIKIPALPFISGDTIINRYFPHVGEPYHVWVDSAGCVKLTSYDHGTNFKNVAHFLKIGQVPANALITRRNVKSLFNESWDSTLEYFSYISRCIDNGQLRIRPDQREAMITSGGCLSAVELYQIAFSERKQPFYRFNREGRTILEVKNPYQYTQPINYDLYPEWAAQYGYNYHLYLPLHKDEEKYKVMREDLARYFKLDAKVVSRKVTCLLLTHKGDGKLLKTKGGKPKDNFIQTDKYNTTPDSLRYYINKPCEGFSRRLAGMIENKFKLPFIDSTNMAGNVDVIITGSTFDRTDLPSLKKELKQYGLILVEKEILIEALVIKDRE